VSRVHGPVDRYSDQSTVDLRPRQGIALTSVWRTTAMEGGSSPRRRLEKEGTEGKLTEIGGGWHGNGAWPATSFNGGGSTHPMRGD
jgi:hypothetical protein